MVINTCISTMMTREGKKKNIKPKPTEKITPNSSSLQEPLLILQILYKLWERWQAENESKFDSFHQDFCKYSFTCYYVLNVDLDLNT